eukprot:608024-Pelagomonas_calceolata.AAC.1
MEVDNATNATANGAKVCAAYDVRMTSEGQGSNMSNGTHSPEYPICARARSARASAQVKPPAWTSALSIQK